MDTSNNTRQLTPTAALTFGLIAAFIFGWTTACCITETGAALFTVLFQ